MLDGGNQMNKNSNMKDKVEEWLSKEGYSLEFYVATQFQKSYFNVMQGSYVRDKDNDSVREIDVIASTDFEDDNFIIRILNVIECKWSKDKPWVIFTSNNSMNPRATIAQSFASSLGDAILWHVSGNEELYNTSYFYSPEYAGFGGRQALTNPNGKDLFYSSMQSITSATNQLTKEYDNKHFQQFNLPKIAVIAFPIIVVDGVLFEAKYDSEQEMILLNETNHVRLHWSGSDSWEFHSTIDVVTKNYIGEFAKQRRKETELLGEIFIKSLKNIVDCYEDKSLKKLNYNQEEIEIIGLPKILYNIDLMKKNNTDR